MLFSRRTILSRFFPGIAGGAVASVLPVAASATTAANPVQKVVYHLSEPTRTNFVLGNIKNHIAGKGGPDKVDIVLVIHGPALEQFVSSKASPDMKRLVAKQADNGVHFVACGNTMAAQKVSLPDLFEGFAVAEEGGVVRIADLQDQGYRYIRP